MAKSLPSLGELETLVLRLVCQEQPCTERQISDRIQQDRAVGRTTVLKTMQRLERKGLLVRLTGEGPVRFRAAVDEKRLLPGLIGRFVDRVLGGSPEALAAYLADSEKLSDKDVEALRAIAKENSARTMTEIIEMLNAWSDAALGLAMAILWQSTLIIGVAAAIPAVFRAASPGWRYWLWQIVVVKLLLMPFWTLGVPLPSFGRNPEARAAANAVASAGATSVARRPSADAPASGAVEMPAVVISSESCAERTWLSQLTWPSWLLAAWLVLGLWQVVRVVHYRVRLHQLLQRASPASDARFKLLLTDASRLLGLPCAPADLLTDCECSPFVCGLWRPVLVLPRKLLTALSATQLRQVLLHELAHIKRRDLVWGWLPETARLVYWFHPLVHWVYYRIRLERELACDELAIRLSRQGAASYAHTLVHVISLSSQRALLTPALSAASRLDGGANLMPPQRKDPLP